MLLLSRSGAVRDTLGAGTLEAPRGVQLVGGAVFVSDLADGRPALAEYGRDGSLRRRHELAGIATGPHQFAVLPDGAIVVEGSDQRLVAVRAESIATFAVVEISPRPSLLTAAGGGVIHAVPDRWITLYNSFGSIRWRIEWPWDETAFVSDLAEDSRGRIHVIAGNSEDETFRVFSLAPASGEVYRWSVPAIEPDFVVDRFGQVAPSEGG